MHYVYVIRSQIDGNLYTGLTSDLRTRFAQHQNGLVRSTKHRRPFQLMYYEAYTHREDASRREIYLKTGMGKRDLYKRLKKGLTG